MLDSSAFVVRDLLRSRLINEDDALRAEQHARGHSCTIVDSLSDLGLVGPRELAITRAKVCEQPFVDLTEFEVDIANARLMPRSVAESLGAFPLFVVDGVATVAIEDPLNLSAIDQVRQVLQLEIDPVVCETPRLRAMITRAYSLVQTHEEPGEDLAKFGDVDLASADEPIVAAVNQIIVAGIELGASDIHINPDERVLNLRYRVDGALRSQQGPSLATHPSLVQRLKVMARLDLTQTRKPQDGKFAFTHKGRVTDVRLSVTPTVDGENVVMRLLRAARSIGTIEDLGMPAEVERWFEQTIERPHGLVLVTGPTGSGKTTTLYTALAAINSPERNIMTIEDPVEIRLPMVRQIQVNADIDMTFATALRSVLRQDPDVILVGEIRDEETARIAVQSALTGHLVFSTLHTNDAAGAIPRLRDFGVPGFAINSALVGVLAQRLVRRACERCSRPHEPTPDEVRLLQAGGFDFGAFVRSGGTFIESPGCNACASTGYSGRIGLYELMQNEGPIREAIETGAGNAELLRAAARSGMRTMLAHGIAKAAEGVTTLSEVRRVVATAAAAATGAAASITERAAA